MRICTIGFTQKSAEDFFTRLRKSGVKRVVDVRLNNVSQLAGFSKRDDLQFVGYDGHTVALLTLEHTQVRPLRAGDIPHARELASA